MTISIDWPTRVITVHQVDLVLVGGSLYELDLDVFRLALKSLEDSEDGMFFPYTHDHNAAVSVGGVTLAQVVILVNGYTVTFEDGQYAVRLVGANSNLGDVVNVNQVSVRSQNSAGLITVVQGSGVTAQDKIDIAALVLAGQSTPPTAPENAAAVGDLVIEGLETLADQIRLIRSYVAGGGIVPAGPGTYGFQNAAGTDTRIEGTITGSARTVTKADGT